MSSENVVTLLSLDILIVDDNVESAFMMSEVLKRAGHQARIAVGGNEAIRASTTQVPDAVLMDINLPDLGGVEAAKRIRTLMPKVIMIAISGMHIPAERQGDMLIFHERLQKPIAREELLSVLDHLFAHRPE